MRRDLCGENSLKKLAVYCPNTGLALIERVELAEKAEEQARTVYAVQAVRVIRSSLKGLRYRFDACLEQCNNFSQPISSTTKIDTPNPFHVHASSKIVSRLSFKMILMNFTKI